MTKNAHMNLNSKINQCLSVESITSKMHTIEVLSALIIKHNDKSLLERLYLKNMIKDTESNYSENIFEVSPEDLKLFSSI